MKITKPERIRRLRRAHEIAYAKADHWWVWTTTRSGEVKQARLVKAENEKAAFRRFRYTTSVKPCLPSSVWREIYAEVGLPWGGES